MNDDADRDILEEVQQLISALESHSDPAVREQVEALLARIDAVHRTALTHLINAIHAMAGDAFVNRLIADPAIRLLLMSYGLVAVDRRIQAEEALDAVRGHLHSHGVDVEILEVVGGVVYVRVHGIEKSGVSLDAVQHDLQEALTAGFIGFQELVLREREGTTQPVAVIPLSGIRRPHRPVYRRAVSTADVPAGRMKAVEIDGAPVLLANVEGEFYAIRNRCGDGPLPLEFSGLEGAEVRCSWHGCRYDVRSGKRLDAEAPRLPVYPVSIEDDVVMIAMDVEALVEQPK